MTVTAREIAVIRTTNSSSTYCIVTGSCWVA